MKSLAASLAAIFAAACLGGCGVPVTSLSLPPQATVDFNGTLQLTPAIAPANANDVELIWSSSDYSIAEVSDLGVVAGLAAGVATIEVTTANGKIAASCQVTVAGP